MRASHSASVSLIAFAITDWRASGVNGFRFIGISMSQWCELLPNSVNSE
jgi:hypothetical protein